MILNYLKIVFRLVTRQKAFAFINIFGLTVGLAGFILTFLFVRYELTYDSHQEKIDRLYMVVRDSYLDNEVYNFTPTPFPFKEAISTEYPEIEKATRFDEWGKMIFHYGDKTFDEPVLVADREVFDMFTFRFVEGDASNPFPDNSSVVISRKIAQKYFGNESAVGKVVQVNGKYDFTVRGVYENFPANSTMRNDIVLPIEFYKTLGRDFARWNSNVVNCFILLKEGVDVQSFEQKLKPRLGKQQQSDKPDELFLHPYKDLHLYNFHYKDGLIETVYIFSIVGIAILALAAINYVNLVTARSIRRAKEIGIRKTAGAGKRHIVFQFLSESILFSLLSLNFAVLIVELILPYINPVINKQLAIEYTNISLILSFIGIAVGTGLLAGAYPAFYLARFSPASVLKSSEKLKSGNFKSALVIVQFAVSIALIITSIVLYRQFQYLRNMPVGFSKENIFYFKLEDETRRQFDVLRREFESLGEVRAVSTANHIPTEIFSNGDGIEWEGKDPNSNVLISFTSADDKYLDVFGMKLVEGRFYQPDEVDTDTVAKIVKVVVNQKIVDMTGFKEPIGKMLKADEWSLEIIGVVEDFNFLQMRRETGPLIIYHNTGGQLGFVKTNGEAGGVKALLEKKYSALFPQYPPNFQLVEDRYRSYFGNEDKNAQMFGYFTLLAILISCLGLYGLASFVAEQRRKEIAIRKALGANTTGLSALMIRQFLIWVAVANALAIPMAWYYLNGYLARYTYKTDISPWVFIAAAGVSLVVAIVTVLFQVLKTTSQNPAVVLKYE